MNLIITLCFVLIAKAAVASETQTPSRPRLGVVLVVDQFRADYLMRFKDRFKKSTQRIGGYKMLMEGGAYFPLADHGLLKNMTGPGHAAILTGSYPYRNQISINYWFNNDEKRMEYCVQDDRYRQIGSNGILENMKGISPKNLNADTVGDTLKNIKRETRVVSVALKDRASVLLGGKRADHAVWFNEKRCEWVTSEFYGKSLPGFAKVRNDWLQKHKNDRYSWGPFKDAAICSRETTQSPKGIEQTFELALGAVDELGLGKGKDTDLLLVSLSSHDYLGHQFGPNDPALEEMTLSEDALIMNFFERLNKKIPGGLANAFIVLTADHGIPHNLLPNEKIPNENVPEKELLDLVEKTLTESHGKPKGGTWVRDISDFELEIRDEALEAAKVKLTDLVVPLRTRLLKERYIDRVWARDEILIDRKVPSGELGQIADRTISKNSGDIILVMKPYFYSDGYPITHMTHYSYDRYVPLIFWGRGFKSGTYRQVPNIVDIAPTLSSYLGVIPPSQSEGRILTEILR